MVLAERATKSAPVSLGRDTRRTVLSIADQGAYSVMNFLTLTIVGRSCGADGLGLYALGFNLTVLITTFQIAILSFPYTVYLPRIGAERLRGFTGSTLVLTAGLSLIALLGLGLTAAFVPPERLPDGLTPVLRILTWAMPAILLRDLLRRELFARLRFEAALLFDVGVAVLQLSVLGAMALEGALTPSRVFLVVGAVTACASLLLILARRADYRIEVGSVVPDFQKMWKLGKWLSISRLLALLGALSYPWIIAGFHDVTVVGLFALYISLSSLLNPVLFAIGNLVGPDAARAQHSGGGRSVRSVVVKASLLSVAVVAVLTVLLVFWGPVFVVRVFGSDYVVTRGLILAFALNQLVWTFPLPVEAGLNAVERSEVILKSTLIGAILTLTVGIYLVAEYQIVGAVSAMIVTNVVTGTYRIWSFLAFTRGAVAPAVTKGGSE